MADDDVTTLVIGAINYARAAERVRGLLAQVRHLIAEVAGLVELDADLAPEATAILEDLDRAGEGIARAHTFLSARYDVVVARATKGDGS